MFRTVNAPSHLSSAVVRLVLCILIGCMSLHFLLEDARLLSAFVSAFSNTASASDLSYDEMTHQDDLIILVTMPVNVAKDEIPTSTAWTVPFKQQTCSPIHTPPKIA